MVVGGGISGIQAALDLATAGFKVYLVEKSPTIGGKMSQLDKTFPTNDCSMCIESPKFIECDRHPNIEILTYTEVDSVEGKAGDFKVTLIKKPRYVIEDKCTGCTTCVEYCPVKIPDPFNQELSLNKAIHIYFSQAIPLVTYIDESCLYLKDKKCRSARASARTMPSISTRCRRRWRSRSGRSCCRRATRHSTPGCGATTATGTFQNVVTSLDFERLLCATGPYEGEILRPSDKKHPHKIAWIHCVGSRQVSPGGNSYCSAVCCTYTQKQVILTKDHDAEMRVHDIPQRHPLLRQGFRAILPEGGEAARGSVHPKLRVDRKRDPGNQERDDPVLHRRRRREGRGVRSGGAVCRIEPSCRCEGACAGSSASSSTLTASARPTPSIRWRPPARGFSSAAPSRGRMDIPKSVVTASGAGRAVRRAAGPGGAS